MLSTIGICSCDPLYQVFAVNSGASPETLWTDYPEYEYSEAKLLSNDSIYSLNINPGDTVLLFEFIGDPHPNSFPMTILFCQDSNKVNYKSRQQIIDALKKQHPYYYIELND